MYQVEIGESGTRHFQGYIEMSKPCRPSKFKELKGAHFEKAQGTPEQCKDYCTKEDTRAEGPFEFGEISEGQGQRSDLISLRDAVRDGRRGRELFDDDAIASAAIRYGRGVESMARAYQSAVRRDNIHVVFHYGPPGVGKSHCAYEDGCYLLSAANGFWLNYKGESHVVMDEFGGHFMSPLELQRVLDVYPYTVNVKGGEIPGNVCLFSFTIQVH